MSVLSSLPPRPLAESEVVQLNRADSVDLAVAVDDESDETTGLLLATDGWVKGLALGEEGWRTVETVDLAETERYDALRACEDAVREQ
jgi:hypothetical protein